MTRAYDSQHQRYRRCSMPVVVRCAQCSGQLKVPRSKIGQVSSCPRCRSPFKVEQAADGTLAVMAIIGPDLPPAASFPPALPPAEHHPLAVQPSKWPVPPERSELQPTPFLIHDGAVVDCPWCFARTRVSDTFFNSEHPCGECKRCFEVNVPFDRHLNAQCPNCLTRLRTPGYMAGLMVRCVDPTCAFGPIQLPNSPVQVVPLYPGNNGFPVPKPP